MTDNKQVCLIDMGSVFGAAWFSSVNDEVSAAHDRSVGQVRKVVHGFDPALVAICCDSPTSWRRDKYPSYKANRSTKDAAAVEQLLSVKETLGRDGYLLWEAEGFEADDCLAAAAKQAVAAGYEVVIFSSDKDLLATVRSEVVVVSLKTSERFDTQAVQAKFGVKPEQMRDYLSLVGDSSDNVQGVPGVGAKTAAELLTKYSSIDDIRQALGRGEEVKSMRISDAIEASAAIIDTAIELVTLREDAPINFAELFEKREVKPLVDVADEWSDEPAVEVVERIATNDVEPKTPAAEAENSSQRVEHAEPAQPTSIVKASSAGSWALELEPTSAREAFTMSKALFNSRLYSNFGSQEAIFAVILRGRSLGLDATTALSNFHVVENKPTMSATLLVGLVLQSGKADYFDLVESTDEQAVYVTRRKGSTTETRMAFTVEDAVAAGLLERLRDGTVRGVSKSGRPSNWDKYRRTMLRHRCAVELARCVYADIAAGIYTADEVSEGRVIEATIADATP